MATLTLDLRDDERLLGHGECSRLVGPLSVPGELYLTTARLYFEPDRLNKLVGIKALVINLSDITDAEVSGIDRVMTVTTGAKRARFMGKWARTVYERPESLVSEESGEDRQCWRHRGAALASHESLLVQSTLDYSATSVVMVPGELVVTPRTVSYTPRRLERLVWRNLEFEAPMDQIEELVLDGPRRVSFKVGDKEHRFNGVGSLEVYAAIWAAQDHPGGDVVYVRGQPATGLSTGPGHLVFKFGPVQVHRGVLAHPGLLIQTWRGLAFLLGGSLDKFIGLPQITRFDWPDVVRLDLSSDTRLVISTAMGV